MQQYSEPVPGDVHVDKGVLKTADECPNADSQPAEKPATTEEDFKKAVAFAAHSGQSGADACTAARIILLLEERKLLEGVGPETKMELTVAIMEVIAGQFGGIMNAVVRMAQAKTFAAQQREITYLTNRLLNGKE